MEFYTKGKYIGLRNAASSLLGFNAKNGDLWMVDNVASLPSESRWRRLCYNVDWKPDPELLEDKPISAYCSVEDTIQSPNKGVMVEDKTVVCHLALLDSDRWHLNQSLDKTKSHLSRYVEWAVPYMSAYCTKNPVKSEWTRLVGDKLYMDQLHGKVEANDPEGQPHNIANICK